jgi:hypothetical protein
LLCGPAREVVQRRFHLVVVHVAALLRAHVDVDDALHAHVDLFGPSARVGRAVFLAQANQTVVNIRPYFDLGDDETRAVVKTKPIANLRP